MPKNKSEGNVLSRMNPISQGEELLDNIKQQNSNVKSIFSNILGMTKDVVTSPAPCEMSKFLTDQVCNLNEKAINIMKGDFKLGFIDFKKVKELAISSKNIVSKITHPPNEPYPDSIKAKSEYSGGNINKKDLNKLISNMTKIEKINKINEEKLKILEELRQSETSQNGGSNLSNYDFILNPLTNKYVSTKSKTGKAILNRYVNTYVNKY
tara:strand:+ start:192 stop:821 length:630 start_codon:yes stop_codon:yes gene_type:complete